MLAGLAVVHVLSAAAGPVPDEALPLPVWACAVGIAGIVVVDKVNKRLYFRGERDVGRARLLAVCACYAAINVWALYVVPRAAAVASGVVVVRVD